MHGWTHRPKSQGGTDPIPAASLPWAYLTQESEITVDAGAGYNLDESIIDWGGTDRFHSSSDADSYFSAFTDTNSKNGIQVLAPGAYLLRATSLIQGESPANLIPPAVHLVVRGCDPAGAFATAGVYYEQSLTPGWLAINYAGTEYVSPFDFGTYVGGTFVFTLTDPEPGSSEGCFTIALSSDGGAHEWYWSISVLTIVRLGSALPE